MYLVLVTYIKPIEEVEMHLANHRAFLDRFYTSGNLICSGPQNPRTGGLLLANFTNTDAVWEFIQKDPYHINGIAKYEVIEFNPVKYAKQFEPFVK
ncbi:MAG: GTP cyclohydrolase [Bacteroidales bacterium]|nr:GTP cyclohydrolase [Bacteroidales bacterium]